MPGEVEWKKSVASIIVRLPSMYPGMHTVNDNI